jgi:hypothetical protein
MEGIVSLTNELDNAVSRIVAILPLEAKRAIADHLGMPLARLSPEQLVALNTLLAATQ